MGCAIRSWALVLIAIGSGCRLHFDAVTDPGNGGDGGDGGGPSAPDSGAPTACLTSAGLVGYWPFDENTGTVANDYSSSGQTGDLTGNPTWTTGHLGAALQFDVNSTVHLRTTAGLSFNGGMGSFTVSYWLAPSSLTVGPNIRPLELAYCTGSSYVVGALLADGTAVLEGYDANNVNASTSSQSGAVRVGRWTHIVHVLNRAAGTGQTFIDGVQSGPTMDITAWTAAIDCSGAQLAANLGGWGGFGYAGLVDDVRIFARALTPGDVGALYGLTATGCP